MAETFDVASRVKFEGDDGVKSGRIVMFCRHIANGEQWAWILLDHDCGGLFQAVPVAALEAGASS